MGDVFSQPSPKRLSDYQIPGINGGRRYKLPLPDDPSKTGQMWVSATTIAHVVEDTFMLSQWQQRKVAQGLATQPELYATACSLEWDSEDEDRANAIKLIEKARDAAGANYGATMGTAYHKYTELTDAGRISSVPADHRLALETYQRTLSDAGIKPIYKYTERACVYPPAMVSGTMDRLFTHDDWDYPVVGDVKTAKNVYYGMTSIAVQLSIYANATHVFDLATETYTEMPPVRKDKALVVWLPIYSESANRENPDGPRCELLWVDIETGWKAFSVALANYNYRKMNNKLVTPYEPLVPVDWSQRIRFAETKKHLSEIWNDAQKAGVWNDELSALGQKRLKEITC